MARVGWLKRPYSLDLGLCGRGRRYVGQARVDRDNLKHGCVNLGVGVVTRLKRLILRLLPSRSQGLNPQNGTDEYYSAKPQEHRQRNMFG